MLFKTKTPVMTYFIFGNKILKMPDLLDCTFDVIFSILNDKSHQNGISHQNGLMTRGIRTSNGSG